jgi:hypothetical protein
MKPMNFPAKKERRRQAVKGEHDQAKLDQARTIRTKKSKVLKKA